MQPSQKNQFDSGIKIINKKHQTQSLYSKQTITNLVK